MILNCFAFLMIAVCDMIPDQKLSEHGISLLS